MRTSLIPGLVKTYKYNANRQQSDLKIFEIGKVYEKDNKGLIKENNCIAGLIAGQNSDLSLKIDSNPVNFFDLKGDLVSMIPDVEFKHSIKCKFLNEDVQAGIFQNIPENATLGVFRGLFFHDIGPRRKNTDHDGGKLLPHDI